MGTQPRTVPRPLVRTNQWFIFLSVLAAWITGQYWVLALPLAAGIMGLAFRFNPVMRFAKLFLTKTPAEYVAEDWDQQQFNQLIAVVCLALGLLGYLAGWKAMAIVFTAMVALAACIAILGFCIGCYIRYQWTQYSYRRKSKQL